MTLAGRVTDYGDVVRIETWRVKGRHLRWRWHLGAPRHNPTTPRTPRARAVRVAAPPTGDLVMDLLADHQVPLSGGYTDEADNPTEPPADATVTYTVDDPSVINLTDNGDGTAVAAATGTLGVGNVHAEASWSGGAASGDLQIVVVAGMAERFKIVAGAPTEVTPDA